MPAAADQPQSFARQSGFARILGWGLRLVIRWLVRIFYPRIEVTGREHLPVSKAALLDNESGTRGSASLPTQPVLFVANHCNSQIDPIMVGIAAGCPIHFFARAPFFQTPFLGGFMRLLGMLPFFRREDDPAQVRQNVHSLEIAAGLLARGEAVGVFPEGESHDALKIERVRTGAARIALMALQRGCPLMIMPVGINYELKEKFRSAVWVRLGEPLDAVAWRKAHQGDERQTMRALTAEIDRRLQAVVIHLADRRWELFLGDLEALLPFARNQMADPVKALRQRKRIADAINHVAGTAPARAEEMAQAIEVLRGRLSAAGLELRSPILHHRGPKFLRILLWQTALLMLGLLPVVLGVLHHLVPYLVTRTTANALQKRGRTHEALAWLGIGLPVFLGWYALVWWGIIWQDYVAEAAWTWTLLMPFCGLLAIRQWRRTLAAIQLWRHQIAVWFNRARLDDLRAETNAVAAQLEKLVGQFRHLHPESAPPALPFPWRWLVGRIIGWSLGLAAVLACVIWLQTRSYQRSLAELIYPGPDLSLVSTNVLAVQLTADETALRDILTGLETLEAKALQVQSEFEAGQRSYYNQVDNDAVRQLLLTYINYRAALLRLVWKYQKHERAGDQLLRLRAALVQVTAGSVLFETSLKLVTQFRRPETIRKLNEAEPLWGIPPDFYNTIRRNLAHTKNRRLLEAAHANYERSLPAYASAGLTDAPPYLGFHTAIRHSDQTSARLLPLLKASDVKVAIADARGKGDTAMYRAKSYVSTWIGDAKIRQPRDGQTVLSPALVAQFRGQLKPGDILLERRNWFLSNAILPGFWPHAVLYVGTPADLRRMGLDQDPRVQAHWRKFVRRDEQGHEHVIIEAVSEGVIFSSFEHSIGGGDAACAMRPRLPPERIREAIARAFSHLGKPYDFEFDFFSTDKLVCTELVFRAYGGALKFPLVEVLGRKTMPANVLVRKCCAERGQPQAELEFIAFLEGDDRKGTAAFKDFTAFEATLKRPGMDWLQ